ncbi:hypothetical protein CKM354_001006600 [Cercospora kikuchii]|uniref:Azaphilone pigments biosynthesis cluster protein L N-terminal domain-containing protein n=1 Tax=Cercospora kikuchii TaxID=84275 RepID=A0A9P3FKE3_9PEZI|nr:uncharacterized protein CKM354_001006600 [Cercospora kikuchii]GIZ46964.1 hypothetical protein CKM354_001006600 [Cercospora kikuchii]
MADPLSISLAVAPLAISSAVSLRTCISCIADAPNELKSTARNLESIEASCEALEALALDSYGSPPVLQAPSIEAAKVAEAAALVDNLKKCRRSCEAFEMMLRKWTGMEIISSANESKMSLKGRFVLGFWNKDRVATINVEINNYRNVLHFAVQRIQVAMQIDSSRQISGLREDLGKKLTDTVKRLSQIQDAIEACNSSQLRGSDVLDREEIVAQRDTLAETVINLGALYFEMRHTEQPGFVIGDVTSGDGAKVFAGAPADLLQKCRVRVGNVRSGNNSQVFVGGSNPNQTFHFT